MVERVSGEMFNDPYEDPRDKLLKICGRLLRDLEKHFQIYDRKLSDSLATLAETIEELYEPDDPRSNGWVGDDGLP